MKILISGGAGFIGSNLINDLLKEGHEIFCVDNFYTGSKSNIAQHLGNPKFHLIIADISKPFSFHTRLDQIFNLACPASPPHYQLDPIHTVKTNVIGTLQLLELAKESGARFLQASTSEVYGDPHVHPQVETYWGNVNPVGPRSCYDEGKRCAETICTDFATQERVDVRIIRIFNTYGPNMALNDGRVVSNFIIQALKNEPITMFGDGKQTRSFQFVSDLISGMKAVMNGSYTKPVNIGNPVEFSMIELAELIGKLLDKKIDIKFMDLPKDDPKQRRPNIELAKSLYNWEPVINLETGIRMTVPYFAKELQKLKQII